MEADSRKIQHSWMILLCGRSTCASVTQCRNRRAALKPLTLGAKCRSRTRSLAVEMRSLNRNFGSFITSGTCWQGRRFNFEQDQSLTAGLMLLFFYPCRYWYARDDTKMDYPERQRNTLGHRAQRHHSAARRGRTNTVQSTDLLCAAATGRVGIWFIEQETDHGHCNHARTVSFGARHQV